MTLNEFMAAAPKEDTFGKPIYYHIGANTSFIMVVTPDEYQEHCAIWTERYRDAFHAKAMEWFKAATTELITHTMFHDSNIRTYYAFQTDIAAHEKSVEKAKHSFVNALKKLAEFMPIGSREVTEVYDRFQGGKVVEITGSEKAPFWDRQEYEREIAKWSNTKETSEEQTGPEE